METRQKILKDYDLLLKSYWCTTFNILDHINVVGI